eukprot:SAG31_NODE_123_length_23712_cov_41.426291_12_plen_130_part_00
MVFHLQTVDNMAYAFTWFLFMSVFTEVMFAICKQRTHSMVLLWAALLNAAVAIFCLPSPNDYAYFLNGTPSFCLDNDVMPHRIALKSLVGNSDDSSHESNLQKESHYDSNSSVDAKCPLLDKRTQKSQT